MCFDSLLILFSCCVQASKKVAAGLSLCIRVTMYNKSNAQNIFAIPFPVHSFLFSFVPANPKFFPSSPVPAQREVS
jgi:hypothetical protein